MKTDQVIYEFLATGPEAFRVLTAGLTFTGNYVFRSLTLSQVLEFWLFERFRTLTAEEIWTMLQHLTPLEETRAYQSIFVKSEAEGEAKGKAEGIKRLLIRRFGPLPDWAEQRIAAAPPAQLDAWLDALLDADSVAALIGPERP